MNGSSSLYPIRHRAPAPAAPTPPWAWLVWATVLALAMLSFYVELLQQQVQRGEGLRAARRAELVSARPVRAHDMRQTLQLAGR